MALAQFQERNSQILETTDKNLRNSVWYRWRSRHGTVPEDCVYKHVSEGLSCSLDLVAVFAWLAGRFCSKPKCKSP